ncbi:hypothetical protein H4582DRAFT_2106873 [Lactarius indigo]|nr:hypothetical protein H4582DRAFT_2106873 [Lactarius indigo]
MPQSSTSNTTDSDASSGPKTNYAYTKPYGGMKGFMESNGLKLWNDDDVQEAKAILDGYREMDATATAEADKANSNTDIVSEKHDSHSLTSFDIRLIRKWFFSLALSLVVGCGSPALAQVYRRRRVSAAQ